LAVGVDIGGTFTDAVVIDLASGVLHQSKAPTTPADLSQGVFDALRTLDGLRTGEILPRTGKFAHGTTQSTNALFTRSGAQVGLIATRGFGDQILIMRGGGRVAGMSLPERRHFAPTRKPDPLVPKTRIREVPERVDYKGAVITPLDRETARRAVEELLDQGVQAIAVGLLWSFRNPAHERALREIVRELAPGAYVSLSSDLAPVIGEYERTATAVIDAYVGPSTVAYLERLASRLRGAGLATPLLILQAGGGVGAVGQVVPAHTIESGPAAGVLASQHLAERLGHRNVIATDVGGTTFKVSLIVDGEWSYARETVIAQYTYRVPMVDVSSIGAGGGSIAWVDEGRLRLGPQSAAAVPGPACYGREGEEPTVTDADVVLGFIDPAYFLGGRMPLQAKLAREAIRRRVAEPLFGGDVARAALGIRHVVNAQMADLIRKVTVERGHDPRDFVLMVYGGAGPTHCSLFGREAGISRAIIPFTASVHSAFGAAVSDVRHTLERSDPQSAPPDPGRVNRLYRGLEAEARARFRAQKRRPVEVELRRSASLRYRRQMHEVSVPVPQGRLNRAALAEVVADFERRYEARYGRGAAYREAGVEFIGFKLEAVVRDPKPRLARRPAGGADPRAALKGRRPVCFDPRGYRPTPIYDGERLKCNNRLRGPAIVEYPSTTVVIGPGQSGGVDAYGNLILDLVGGRG
jgi:N-methylhydantoinase A